MMRAAPQRVVIRSGGERTRGVGHKVLEAKGGGMEEGRNEMRFEAFLSVGGSSPDCRNLHPPLLRTSH